MAYAADVVSVASISQEGSVLHVVLEKQKGDENMAGTRKSKKITKTVEVKNVKSEKDINVPKILLHPVGTEKAVRLLDQNKIVFAVDRRATKKQIKEAFQVQFDVSVESVNTMISTKSKKKAYIKLSKDSNAMDVATNLGLL